MQLLSKALFACFAILSVVHAWNEIDLSNSRYISSLKQNNKLDVKDPPKTIGIVGGGIGGTSSAYFLRKLFGNDVQIDLYESKTKLCGRIATVEIGNRLYESGGAILHPKNMYAKTIAKEFGLTEAKSFDTYTAIFDGENYVLQTSQWSIITFIKFLWTFGLDFLRLMWFEKDFIDKFCSIYDLHKDGHSYTSVKNLLTAMNGQVFTNASEISGCQLFTDKGYKENIVENLVNAGLRTNYGQICGVNGFVTMVSMAGIQPNLWAVNGGNNQLCKKVFENSTATLLNEQVTKITKDISGKFVVQTTKHGSGKMYDILVIATPINRDKSNIDVEQIYTGKGECPSAVTDPRHYRRTIATMVKGKLNPDLFGCDSLSSCPDSILMSKDLFYRSVGLQSPVDFDPDKGDSVNDTVYKVFSTDSLTEEQLSVLFESRSEKVEVDWWAYPHYQPPDELSTFVLNENGVYYTSPIEWAASAMEMSLLSAKNTALLAFNKWYDIHEKVDNITPEQKHSEL